MAARRPPLPWDGARRGQARSRADVQAELAAVAATLADLQIEAARLEQQRTNLLGELAVLSVPPPAPALEWLPVADAAARYHCSADTVRRRIRDGRWLAEGEGPGLRVAWPPRPGGR